MNLIERSSRNIIGTIDLDQSNLNLVLSGVDDDTATRVKTMLTIARSEMGIIPNVPNVTPNEDNTEWSFTDINPLQFVSLLSKLNQHYGIVTASEDENK